MVVFAPTAQAIQALGRDARDLLLGEDWETARERVLSRLRSAKDANALEALTELLTRLPDAKAPLTYCTEMIGALLLNMQRAKHRADGLNPFRALAALRTHDSAKLETLAGLSVGATLVGDDEVGRTLTQRLIDSARDYQSGLSRLSEEGRAALVDFLEEALEALD
jgi:hypothetical protein